MKLVVQKVLTRPDGSEIAPVLCSDGQVHIFEYVDGPKKHPACGADVAKVRSAESDDLGCVTCKDAAVAWVKGGPLRAPGANQ